MLKRVLTAFAKAEIRQATHPKVASGRNAVRSVLANLHFTNQGEAAIRFSPLHLGR